MSEGKVDTQRPQTYTIAFKNQQCGCVNNVLALFDTTTRPSDMNDMTNLKYIVLHRKIKERNKSENLNLKYVDWLLAKKPVFLLCVVQNVAALSQDILSI